MNKVQNNNYEATIIADLLSSNLKISQMRRKMFFIEDLSARIPKLSFSILNEDKESIYMRMKTCLESYNGNLSWTLQYPKTRKDSKDRLYIIIPQLIANMNLLERGNLDRSLENTNTEIGYLGEDYEDFCLQAIKDIKDLNNHIKQYMKW